MCVSIQTRSSQVASTESELSTLRITLPSVSLTSAFCGSSSAGKQLGLCVLWVFSSRLCFYLLVALRIYRVVMALSLWGDAERFFYLGYVALLSLPSLNLSSPRLSCVKKCWLLGFPVLSAVLITSKGKKMQCLRLTQNGGCFFLHDNSKTVTNFQCAYLHI